MEAGPKDGAGLEGHKEAGLKGGVDRDKSLDAGDAAKKELVISAAQQDQESAAEQGLRTVGPQEQMTAA